MHLEKMNHPEKCTENCNKRKKMGILKKNGDKEVPLLFPDWEMAFAKTGIFLYAYGTIDKVIWHWHQVYSGSVQMNRSSRDLTERMIAECLEETLLAQYENGMLLFVLLAEGLPVAWAPKGDRQKRIKEEVRPLITKIFQKNGSKWEGRRK